MTKFVPGKYTATQYSSVADKEKFARHFVRFAESGFKETLFPKWFYQRLSNCFGHIAHYNQAGFYGTWFATTDCKLDFLMRTALYQAYEQAAYTYCDVERDLAAWVKESGMIEQYQVKMQTETEARERAQMAALKAKYEGKTA